MNKTVIAFTAAALSLSVINGASAARTPAFDATVTNDSNTQDVRMRGRGPGSCTQGCIPSRGKAEREARRGAGAAGAAAAAAAAAAERERERDRGICRRHPDSPECRGETASNGGAGRRVGGSIGGYGSDGRRYDHTHCARLYYKGWVLGLDWARAEYARSCSDAEVS